MADLNYELNQDEFEIPVRIVKIFEGGEIWFIPEHLEDGIWERSHYSNEDGRYLESFETFDQAKKFLYKKYGITRILNIYE